MKEISQMEKWWQRQTNDNSWLPFLFQLRFWALVEGEEILGLSFLTMSFTHLSLFLFIRAYPKIRFKLGSKPKCRLQHCQAQLLYQSRPQNIPMWHLMQPPPMQSSVQVIQPSHLKCHTVLPIYNRHLKVWICQYKLQLSLHTLYSVQPQVPPTFSDRPQ